MRVVQLRAARFGPTVPGDLDRAAVTDVHDHHPFVPAGAVHQRFGEGDLASILAANLDPSTPDARQAGEDKSLTQGTAGWAALGTTTSTSTSDLNGRNDSQPVEGNR